MFIVREYLFHELVGVVRDVFLVGDVALHGVFAVRVIDDVHFGVSHVFDDVRFRVFHGRGEIDGVHFGVFHSAGDVRFGVFHGPDDVLDGFRGVREHRGASRVDCDEGRNCDESEL